MLLGHLQIYINLVIRQSDLRGGNFTLRMTGSENTGHIEITNSTWGHLNVSSGFDISISNCYYSEIRTTTIPLIDAAFCNITIKNSLFYWYDYGLAVLRAVFSHIQIQNITFLMGEIYEVELPVILAKNQSKLRMENCSIILSGTGVPMVHVKVSSEAKVLNCTFIGGNEANVRQPRLFNSQNGSGTRKLPIIELEYVFVVVGSHLLVSRCTFISVAHLLDGEDYSELMITESTFDSSFPFIIVENNTKINFGRCIFVRLDTFLKYLINSTAQINDSDITLNNVNDFVTVYHQSKVYIKNSSIANNSFKSFICAEHGSGSYLKIENCSCFNNTGTEDQSTFFNFNNNSVVVQNSYFNNNNVSYLIQTESSSILFQGTSFYRSMNMFMDGGNNRVTIYDCTIYFDEYSELYDSVLNIKNSKLIGGSLSVINAYKFKSCVNVINSMFNGSMITMYSNDINIAESHFENSKVMIYVGTPNIRVANSRFDSSHDTPLLTFGSFGEEEETCYFQTLDTILFGNNSSVKSNVKHFMDQAEKEGLIVGETSRIKHIETAYASGKYYIAFQITKLRKQVNG